MFDNKENCFLYEREKKHFKGKGRINILQTLSDNEFMQAAD